MGRGKLSMEYIATEKARKSSFKKRKEGLVKKIRELSILCGIDACMIIYGPQSSDGDSMEVHTWPKDRNEMESILKKYEMKRNESCSKHLNLTDFFGNQTCKINEQISKTRREIAKARFAKRMGLGLEGRTADELNAMLVDVDKMTETVVSRIKIEREKQKMNRGLAVVEMMKLDESQSQESDLNKIVMVNQYRDHQSYLDAQATMEHLKPLEPTVANYNNYLPHLPLQFPNDSFLTHNYPTGPMADSIPMMIDNKAYNFGQFEAPSWEPRYFQTNLYASDGLKNYGMGFQEGSYPMEQPQQNVLTSVLPGNCFQSGDCCCEYGDC